MLHRRARGGLGVEAPILSRTYQARPLASDLGV